MKYSNFRNYCQKDTTAFAEVDVTTGLWPFNKTRTLEIFKSIYSIYWRDLTTGEYVKDMPASYEEAYNARKLLTKIS